MPQVYKENTLTLVFSESGTLGNEIKLVKSVLTKFNKVAHKAGFKKDFTPDEIEMIKTLAKVDDAESAIKQ